jgi:hypothetical protein
VSFFLSSAAVISLAAWAVTVYALGSRLDWESLTSQRLNVNIPKEDLVVWCSCTSQKEWEKINRAVGSLSAGTHTHDGFE